MCIRLSTRSINRFEVGMSSHLDTLFRCQAKQLSLYLLFAACLTEKQSLPMPIKALFCMIQLGIKPTTSCTPSKHCIMRQRRCIKLNFGDYKLKIA